MKAKWDGSIHPYELPVVPCMVRPSHSEGYEFVATMIERLRGRAAMDVSAFWALETITELQRLWLSEGDKLEAIEQIIRGEEAA